MAITRYLNRSGTLLFVAIIFLFIISFTVIQLTSSVDYLHSHHHQIIKTSSYLYLTGTCSYPSLYMKPLYRESLNMYKHVQLIFYRKAKMSVAIEISHKRGWTIPRIAHTTNELNSLLKDDTFVILFTSSKELTKPSMTPYINHSNILATGIPNVYYFTGTKREQYTTYQHFLRQHDCSIEDLKFMPNSYLMDDLHQCKSLHRQLELSNQPQMWVLKKSQGFGGDGITVISNTTVLQQMFNTCPSEHQYIVQEYISNMLLLNGRKFDIRALILIANTRPYMVFYHHGYLRVVMSLYNSSGKREVHLTNTHVQSMQSNFDPESHFWSFERFQSHLNKNYPQNDDFVSSRLIPYIKEIAVFILKSGRNMINDRALSAYQLIGLDLMVTKDWHIWFIEANNYPLWPKGGWITSFTSTMGEDLFDLVIEMRQRPQKFLSLPVGKWYRSWQLVWRESPPNCEKKNYNPCLSLRQIS